MNQNGQQVALGWLRGILNQIKDLVTLGGRRDRAARIASLPTRIFATVGLDPSCGRGKMGFESSHIWRNRNSPHDKEEQPSLADADHDATLAGAGG